MAEETMVIPVNGIYEEFITWKDSDGNPINLTGATAKMAFKTELSLSAPAIFTLTEDSGLTLGGVEGTIGVKIVPDKSSKLEGKKGFADLLVWLGGSDDPYRLFVRPWIGSKGTTDPS